MAVLTGPAQGAVAWNRPATVDGGMDDPHAHQRRIANATFAVLTAVYHDDRDSAEQILAELDEAEVRHVAFALASVARGLAMNAEAIAGAEQGAALPQIVRRVSASLPWLQA